jgi:hypothetical protein
LSSAQTDDDLLQSVADAASSIDQEVQRLAMEGERFKLHERERELQDQLEDKQLEVSLQLRRFFPKYGDFLF